VVLSALKAFFAGSRQAAHGAACAFLAPLSPDQTFYAVGDIHGRDDLLTSLLARLDAEGEAGSPVIFLGDFVDRGPASRSVTHGAWSGDLSDGKP